MMPHLFTVVSPEKPDFALRFDQPVMTIGSCFSDEVGSRLLASGFDVAINPMGTLYNPLSIADALQAAMEGRKAQDADIVQHDGRCYSWRHHGSISAENEVECKKMCDEAVEKTAQVLSKAKLLIVTFGTSWVFHLATGGQVVANCHKQHPHLFERRQVSVVEIVQRWEAVMKQLKEFNCHMKVVFTVSPIRHLADGAHGNQLSKATLLLATEELCKRWEAYYFPAYEIVMDELRDYRFYAPDLTHLSVTAIDIVWHRFQETFLSAADMQQAHNNAKQARKLQHRPIH
ncbi:MAG: GSCFA domain-containing protein [Bacteroidales bacterium]|nr:GSCFA domain-containing protein [Bacteroidales bacterium]